MEEDPGLPCLPPLPWQTFAPTPSSRPGRPLGEGEEEGRAGLLRAHKAESGGGEEGPQDSRVCLPARGGRPTRSQAVSGRTSPWRGLGSPPQWRGWAGKHPLRN